MRDSKTDLRTFLIVPCYNEAERLNADSVKAFLAESKYNVTILLVNDGSFDNTADIIDKFADADANIQALHLEKNSGKAEAVRQGILKALEQKPDIVGYWDADMATPLPLLNDFINSMSEYNVEAVFGLRLARLGARVRRKTLRHYLGRIFATVVSNILGLQVYDTQCGAKIFKAGIAEKIFLKPFLTKWLFDVEILKRIIEIYGSEKTSQVVYELPLQEWRDVSGSKLGISQMLKVPFLLFKIFTSK